MALYRVGEVGSVGLVTDVDPVLLPPAGWSSGRNVRFIEGEARRFIGHTNIGTPVVAPYYLLPAIKGDTLYWVYCGLDKVYSWDGTTHTNITRQDTGADEDYTGAASDLWNGGLLQGVLVLNNGVDAPQMWIGSDLENLDWDSGSTWDDKGYTAKVIRPYRNFLVALDWNDGSNDFPQSVYWSNQADPLSVPSDWDYADAANEAGIATLAATQGAIVDGEQLRDSFIVYKEDAIASMQYVGGAYVMQFRDVSRTTGILAQRCAKEWFGNHFVLAQDDIVVHDGQSIRSVVDRRTRRSIFSAISPTYYYNSFVLRSLSTSEMWVCFTETGDTLPSRAAVWNWATDTWSHRDLPDVPHIGFGTVPLGAAGATWTGDTDTWAQDTGRWSDRSYSPATQRLIGATATDLYQFDSGALFDGATVESYVQRDDILLDGQMTTKMVRAIYPRATGGAMQVSIGSKYGVDQAYSWEGPYTFTPGSDAVVRVRSTGRFHAVKFTFPAGAEGALQGYDMEYEVVGGR